MPGYLCKCRLHNCPIWVRPRESPHIFEIPRRKSPHIREGQPQVRRQPVDDLGAPAFPALAFQYSRADVPVKKKQLPIGRDGGFKLGRTNSDTGFPGAAAKLGVGARAA